MWLIFIINCNEGRTFCRLCLRWKSHSPTLYNITQWDDATEVEETGTKSRVWPLGDCRHTLSDFPQTQTRTIMEIPVFTVDAFTNLPFKGNPAAVFPLNHVSTVELKVTPLENWYTTTQ